MANHKRKKMVKVCDRCGVGGLAWGNLGGEFKLFEGYRDGNGDWQTNLDKPHHCAGKPNGGGHDLSTGGPDHLALVCSCGYKIVVERNQWETRTPPICSACETLFEEVQVDTFTPETIGA